MKEESVIDLQSLFQGAASSVGSGDVEDFVTARLVLDCHCDLGEGVVFDEVRREVLWTDIMGSKFYRLVLDYDHPDKVRLCTYDLPKKLGSFGMVRSEKNGDEADVGLPLLCAWEDGFQLYDVERGVPLSEMSEGEDVNPKKGLTRLNDGRVDPAGRYFVCGGYYGGLTCKGIKMKVYRVGRIDSDGSGGDTAGVTLAHFPIVDDIETTNSIAWSLDGKTMYLADSPIKTIFAYDYDTDSGTVSNRTLLHEIVEIEHGVPDGSCVDSEGYIWNAVWRSGRGRGMVQRIHPVSGKAVFTVHMPDTTSRASCCCFGGEDLDILFITTASMGSDSAKEPHAGGLYAVKLPFKGRKESRFCLP